MSSDLKKFFEEIFCQDQKVIFLSLYKGNRKRSRKDAERVRRDRPGTQSRRDEKEDRSEARERTHKAIEEQRPREHERLEQRHSWKADSQLEQIEEGSAAGEDQRSKRREKERQRERTAGEPERMPSS